MARARRPPSPSRRNARHPRRSDTGREPRPRGRWRRGLSLLAAGAIALAAGALFAWPAVSSAWRSWNTTDRERGAAFLAEARAAIALGRAGDAERALARSSSLEPSDPEPWRLRLELLRVEDRGVDAQRVGWEAYAAVPPGPARRGVLKGLTLALLADMPDDLARSTLAHWAEGSSRTVPGGSPDPDARVALLQRFGAMPRAGDLDRDARVAELAAVLESDPGHLAAREALVSTLADSGEPERGRAALEAWPEAGRDARYRRLKGRWELEFDHRPELAVGSFRRALEELPHDWKTRVRLARALRASGRDAEARVEAEAVGRLRERLDPGTLGPRLVTDLDRANPREPMSDPDPLAMTDLADLCAAAGLTRLAEAWRREAAAPPRAMPALHPEERPPGAARRTAR